MKSAQTLFSYCDNSTLFSVCLLFNPSPVLGGGVVSHLNCCYSCVQLDAEERPKAAARSGATEPLTHKQQKTMKRKRLCPDKQMGPLCRHPMEQKEKWQSDNDGENEFNRRMCVIHQTCHWPMSR